MVPQELRLEGWGLSPNQEVAGAQRLCLGFTVGKMCAMITGNRGLPWPPRWVWPALNLVLSLNRQSSETVVFSRSELTDGEIQKPPYP